MMTLTIITCMAVAPCLFAFILFELFESRRGERVPHRARVGIGDPIVYVKPKVSMHPCARAREVHAAETGDSYSYLVNKYWTVADVLADGRIVARTRTNKEHYLRPDDPNLRKAGLLDRLRHRDRFPSPVMSRA